MQHREGTFRGVVGLELFYQRWGDGSAGDDSAGTAGTAGTDTGAALAIVHGFGEHSGRYMNVVRHLVPRGFAVYAFDNRGFGRSEGQRGHIDDWGDYRGDTAAFLRLVREEEGGARGAGERPIFLMGHSMGGLIALDYILRDPSGLRGAILSGPGMRPVGVAKPHLVMIARLLSRIRPRFSMDIGLDCPAVSRDPEVVRALREDPLHHSLATVRFGTESLATIDWIWRHAGELDLPVLVVQGAADRLVAAQGARDLFDKLALADKELHVYEGVFHEPHNDLGYEEILGDLSSWLERHLE